MFHLVAAIDRALETHPSLKARSNSAGIVAVMDAFGIYDVAMLDAVLLTRMTAMTSKRSNELSGIG